ncbi:MAG: FadR family transcriptional regulator [Candidatus Dormibacteraeota bacterium]|nr:FadR family transcriptional regulator [Candidatus Dormibacteraeota bacterium]
MDDIANAAPPAAVASPHQALLEPITRTTVTQLIVRRLTGYILGAGLSAGDRMPSERQLMTQLNVGRSSLREAVKTLTALGVLRVAGGEGMFVGDGSGILTEPMSWGLLIGHHGTREVVEARRVIEVALAGQAASRATPEDVDLIADRLLAMREALDAAEPATDADLAFHAAIASAARNRVLAHVLDTLRSLVRVWIYQTFTEFPERRTASYQEHVSICEAIRDHDAATAESAMRVHLEHATERLMVMLERTHTSAEAPEGERAEAVSAPPG